MTGPVRIEPGDPDFAAAAAALSVSAWQPERTPAAIVRVGSAQEVAAAVRAAAEHGHRVAVRSGGHSLSATHLADGAVTIDLRTLNRIEVDPASATAWVEPGVTVAQAARDLHRADMSFPLGHAPTVGLGGYLLAGGNGWNTPRWGHGCERVVAAEVVLPDGDHRVVGPEQDADLWRAVRGAGPLLPAVVLRFQVRLERGAARVRRAFAVVDASRPESLGGQVDALLERLPDSIETTLFWRPANRHRSHPEATIALTSFDLAVPLVGVLARPGWHVSEVAPTSLAETVATLPRHEDDALVSDHVWTNASYASVLPRLPQRADILTDCSSILLTTASRRADGAVPEHALYRPTGTMSVSPYAHWAPRIQDWRPQLAWARSVTDGLADLTTGHYVGEADLTDGPDAVVRCFPPETRPRLAAVLEMYDPHARMAWTASAQQRLGTTR